MIAVVQRVSRAEVRIEDETVGKIGPGQLILLGVAQEDDEWDAAWLAAKCAGLRIFRDDEGKMNVGLEEAAGEVLVVSQFTLLGDCRKGRRPSFVKAASPEEGNRLYEVFVRELQNRGIRVETGVFQAMMDVELVNDGPVTLLVDSTVAREKRSKAR